MKDAKLSQNQMGIVDFLLKHESAKSSDIHQAFVAQGNAVSLVTIKRALSSLKETGDVEVQGTGPSTRYTLSIRGRVSAPIDAHAYCSVEPDTRFGFTRYNNTLFPSLGFDFFTSRELTALENATHTYREKTAHVSHSIHQKELERFVIELSWKSSKIEGNTYTLLDTERLLSQGIEAPGHTKDEALMLLNHKGAFAFIYTNRESFKTLTRATLEKIHELLVKGLPIQRNFRAALVGITGSRYQPPDNQYQIAEAVEALTGAIARMPHAYAQALLALAGVSYIQPFEDGNKRTARLTTNALLLAHGLCPLSYRSVLEESYREALLVFYELNSLEALKKIFIEQYQFAADTYRIG